MTKTNRYFLYVYILITQPHNIEIACGFLSEHNHPASYTSLVYDNIPRISQMCGLPLSQKKFNIKKSVKLFGLRINTMKK